MRKLTEDRLHSYGCTHWVNPADYDGQGHLPGDPSQQCSFHRFYLRVIDDVALRLPPTHDKCGGAPTIPIHGCYMEDQSIQEQLHVYRWWHYWNHSGHLSHYLACTSRVTIFTGGGPRHPPL